MHNAFKWTGAAVAALAVNFARNRDWLCFFSNVIRLLLNGYRRGRDTYQLWIRPTQWRLKMVFVPSHFRLTGFNQ